MKLTIEQVAKLTKLSVPTLRVYASRQKLGKKEGNKRYFTQDDVKKLLKGSPAPASKKKASKKAKPAAAKKATRTPAKAARKTIAAAPAAKRTEPASQPVAAKKSFWSFLRRDRKQKVTLMEAKGLRR
jgi:Helix-turn-helix domain